MNQQLQKQTIKLLCSAVLLLITTQHLANCQAARDDALAPFLSYALSPFNRVAPNTIKGISSDLNSAQDNVVATFSPGLDSLNEMMKSMQDATNSRYQAMDKMFIKFLAEIAQPENLCRQMLAESKNALKMADAEAASLMAQATSAAGQASQGASSFMNKFTGLG